MQSTLGDFLVKAIIVKLGGRLPPTLLHLISKVGHGNKLKEFLAMAQLKNNVAKPLGISKTTFYRKLEDLGPQKRKEATSEMVSTFKRIGAIPSMSPKCELVTLGGAIKLLTMLQVDDMVINSIMSKVLATDYLSSSSSSSHPSEVETSSNASSGGSSMDGEDEVDGDDDEGDGDDDDDDDDDDGGGGGGFGSITNNDGDQPLELGRYGLTSIKNTNEKKACMAHINLEMIHFKEWCQAIYQPNRPIEFKAQSAKTWESQAKRVHEFLGYLHHHKGIKRPSLKDYLDTWSFTSFLDFLKARGVDKAGHTKAIHASIRVVSFIKELATTDQPTARASLKVLKDLGNQIGQNMVPMPKLKGPQELKEQGKWLDAPQLMAKVEGVRLNALAQVKGMKDGNVARMEAAKSVHNALLATMCFGYMPPLRHNSVLLTITAPPHHGCIHIDCQHKDVGCKGNRVYRHSTKGNWWLEVPHHKNTRAWKGTPIRFELPSEVEELLDHHLQWAHRTLTGMLDEVAPTLFVNTTTGMPMKEQEVSQVWSKTVLQGTGVHFGPQMCRSIFASSTHDLGVSNTKGMAMIMGTSQNVWDNVYDKHFDSREAHEAMSQMPTIRKQLLEMAQVPPRIPSPPIDQ